VNSTTNYGRGEKGSLGRREIYTTRINNISYSNLDNKIVDYITAKQYNDFLVSECLMSNGLELSFDNINILNPFIQIKQTQIPITFILIMLILRYVIITLVIKFKKYLIFKPRQIHIEITSKIICPKMKIPLRIKL